METVISLSIVREEGRLFLRLSDPKSPNSPKTRSKTWLIISTTNRDVPITACTETYHFPRRACRTSKIS